jgi:hypothetical protein
MLSLQASNTQLRGIAQKQVVHNSHLSALFRDKEAYWLRHTEDTKDAGQEQVKGLNPLYH